MSPNDYIYDIETYPNVWTCTFIRPSTDETIVFEISDRRNDYESFVQFILHLKRYNCRMVGFNNVGFDYPVIHAMLKNPQWTVAQIYNEAMRVITGDRFDTMVWESDHVVHQVDLYLINHFDNVSKSTSLKGIEVAMRLDNVEDLPLPLGENIAVQDIPTLIDYNRWDCIATVAFYHECYPAIAFREEIQRTYGIPCINYNDTKIGKQLFIDKLEEHTPGCCYTKNPSGRGKTKRQTIRDSIALNDVIFPYISFGNPEFDRVLIYLKRQTIVETKGVFKGLIATVGGVDFVFGTGGIHASRKKTYSESDDTHMIIDIDVTAFYPSLSIVNQIHPDHLGTLFCHIYSVILTERAKHPKGTTPNGAFKLAANGTFGDTNSKFSPLFDPQYTMAVTVNGQLMLCMLVEWLLTQINGLTILQANTDGITVRCPRDDETRLRDIVGSWELMTGLRMEYAIYKRMWMRDVNNYIAEDDKGKLKNKGEYVHKNIEWHKDHSNVVSRRAAEQFMVNGTPVAETVRGCTDPFDFMLCSKPKNGGRVMLNDVILGKILRYTVTTNGAPLYVVRPIKSQYTLGHYKKAQGVSDQQYFAHPTDIHNPDIHTKNKSVHTQSKTAVESGWLVTNVNKRSNFDWSVIDYEYYIQAANSLIIHKD